MSYPGIYDQVQEDPQDLWMDMLFGVDHFDVRDGRLIILCRAETSAGRASLRLVVPSSAGPLPAEGIDPENSSELNSHAVFDQGVELSNPADQSNPLASWLLQWGKDGFRLNLPFLRPKPKPLVMTAIHLGDKEVDAKRDIMRLKLFHDHAPYAEAFLNINLPKGLVALNEKDSEYRGAMVRHLLRMIKG